MAYPKETSTIAKSWMEKALELTPGEELFIPCDSKSKQASLKTRLYGARREYSAIDPVAAEEITFTPVYREDDQGATKPYIMAYKSKVQANKGFIKGKDNVVREVIINTNKDRTKKVLLLIKDGKNQKETEEVLGELSSEEKQMFKEE